VVCPANEEGAAYGAALHAMWVWEHARGHDVAIEDIAARFVKLDEKTRAVPDRTRAAIYRELQGIFDRTAQDLGAAFGLHRRFITASR